jgi:hypothetical protein
MGMEPGYRLNLEPGMVADFNQKLDLEGDGPHWGPVGWKNSLDEQMKEFCKVHFQHPYFFLGTNTGDWSCHIQISNLSDAAILLEHCTAEEIKKSWRWGAKEEPDHYTQEADIRKQMEEATSDYEREDLNNHLQYLMKNRPDVKQAWKPLPCFACNGQAFYANDPYEAWVADGRIKDGVIVRHGAGCYTPHYPDCISW